MKTHNTEMNEIFPNFTKTERNGNFFHFTKTIKNALIKLSKGSTKILRCILISY